MPAPLVQQGATVTCAHGGQAQPTAPSPRVVLGGAPALTITAPWTVSACPLPPSAGGPCLTAVWSAGTVRATSLGQPLVLVAGVATCVPTGVPLVPAAVQSRVRAT